MAYLSVKLQPGVWRNGTQAESIGRFYDQNHTRWQEGGELVPIRGWRVRDADADALEGMARALLPWRDNDGNRWIGIATNSHLYVQDATGTVTDITPVGFVPGLQDSTVETGYGNQEYGLYAYGVARPDTGDPSPPAMGTLDLWNDKLVFCQASDGKIYQWDLDVGTPAEVVTNAPEDVQAIVVTAEGFLMALYGRTVQWSDQADNTIWTPSDLNQAREYDLQTDGQIMCGLNVKGGTLLFTSTDCWAANYIGYPIVYGFEKVGSGCGIISRGSAVQVNELAVWMGTDGFYQYNGYVQRVPCDVWDLVFNGLNRAQQAKVTGFHIAAAQTVRWIYPSAASTECDSYVEWCYGLNCWAIGTLDRTVGADKGVFDNQLQVGSDGLIYEHEVGFDYDGDMPFAETGPFQLSNGEYLQECRYIIPDEKILGQVSVTLKARTYPNASEITYGPYSLTALTPVLFQAGQVSIRYEGVALADWRIGLFKLDIVRGDPLL